MVTIREIEAFKLIFEPQQRMYRLINVDNGLLSYWFNSNDLLVMSDKEFVYYCLNSCKH